MRGPRPYPSSILSTSAHPTLLQPTPAARSHPIHSSLSFKQHLTGPSKSGSVIESTNGETDAQAGIFKAADVQLDEAIDYSSQDMQEPDLPPPNSSSRIGSVLLPPEDSLVSIDVEADLTTLEQMPSPTDDPFTPNTTLTPSITAKTKLKSGSKSKQKIRSPHSPAQGVSNLANPVNSAISHTIDNSQSNSNNNAIAYEFGKSTLTYDFFWSSHSTASTSIKSKSTTSPASKSYRNVFGVSVGAAEADTGRSGSR